MKRIIQTCTIAGIAKFNGQHQELIDFILCVASCQTCKQGCQFLIIFFGKCPIIVSCICLFIALKLKKKFGNNSRIDVPALVPIIFRPLPTTLCYWCPISFGETSDQVCFNTYLSQDGIRQIKSELTNDIFHQEMLHTYEQKSFSRDELVRKARTEMKTLVQEMRQAIGNHPEVESLMMTLASQLETVTGKKKYGYLPKDVKRTVNEIINQMERFPVVADCYQTWWEHQCQIEDFYLEKERQRPPLSDQKEFRSIKNAVIQEAENIRLGKVTFEDKGAEAMAAHAATDISSLPYDCWKLWIIADDDTAPMAERDRAAAQIIREAENSDPYAQYLTGKLYRDGPVLIPDSVESLYWFEQAARQDHVAAQYETGKLLLSHDPEVHDPELGIQWLECAAQNKNGYAAYRLGKEYLEGKIVPKDTTKAITYLTQSAEAGNQYAQYSLGKLYLEEHDQGQAHYWFTQSASQGNHYAQFFLDRWDNLKPPSVMLAATRLLYHMGRIFQDQTPSPPVHSGIQVDRKLRARIMEQKIARGHKPDDHEDCNGPSLSM